MMEMGKRKAVWDTLTRTTAPRDIPREEWWSAQDGRELESETELCKKGLVFFCITLPKISSTKA